MTITYMLKIAIPAELWHSGLPQGLGSACGLCDSLKMAGGIELFLASIQSSEDSQVVLHIAGYEEVATGTVSSLLSQLVGPLRILKQVEDPFGTLRWSTCQVSRPPVNNLQGYASCLTSYYGTPLPQGLGHRQAKPLSKGLLDHHLGPSLESVHLQVADAV